jgi:hypothetical protein
VFRRFRNEANLSGKSRSTQQQNVEEKKLYRCGRILKANLFRRIPKDALGNLVLSPDNWERGTELRQREMRSKIEECNS